MQACTNTKTPHSAQRTPRTRNRRRKEAKENRNLEEARLDLKENLRRGIGEGRVRLNRRWRGARTRRGWWAERRSSSPIASDPSAASYQWTAPFSPENGSEPRLISRKEEEEEYSAFSFPSTTAIRIGTFRCLAKSVENIKKNKWDKYLYIYISGRCSQ